MNYLLFAVILLLLGGAYYTHTQDQQTIAGLQVQLDQAQTKAADVPAAVATTPSPAGTPHPSTGEAPATGMTHDLDSPAPLLTNNSASLPPSPQHHAVVTDNPDDTHSTAIDSAAEAAQAAATSSDIGTVTTLDNHSYTNCKVIKVEQDGVTFSDDTGITKIEYAMMPPALQKKFGYASP